ESTIIAHAPLPPKRGIGIVDIVAFGVPALMLASPLIGLAILAAHTIPNLAIAEGCAVLIHIAFAVANMLPLAIFAIWWEERRREAWGIVIGGYTGATSLAALLIV